MAPTFVQADAQGRGDPGSSSSLTFSQLCCHHVHTRHAYRGLCKRPSGPRSSPQGQLHDHLHTPRGCPLLLLTRMRPPGPRAHPEMPAPPQGPAALLGLSVSSVLITSAVLLIPLSLSKHKTNTLGLWHWHFLPQTLSPEGMLVPPFAAPSPMPAWGEPCWSAVLSGDTSRSCPLPRHVSLSS